MRSQTPSTQHSSQRENIVESMGMIISKITPYMTKTDHLNGVRSSSYRNIYPNTISWIDADAMIMNFEQKLEDKTEEFMGDNDVMVVKPYPKINTGMIFVVIWTLL